MSTGRSPSSPLVLRGRVQSGKSDAARWLALFNDAYVRKTGMPIFPGSLNLALEVPFDWFEPSLQDAIIQFQGKEFGSERDIVMLPCNLRSLGSQRAFLWATTRGASDPDHRGLVEIIAPVSLRDTYGLRDGDLVEIEIAAASSMPPSRDRP